MNTTFLHGNRWARWLVLLLALTVLAIMAAPASADPPTTTPLEIEFGTTIPASSDFCAFDIDISVVANGIERVFTDQDGNVIRVAYNFVEQDTFTANGHQLVGYPFRNVQQLTIDENGDVTHAYETGVIERVPLPDGTTFLSAGRLDFTLHNFDFQFVPDAGHSGDVAAFCAALAP